MTANTLVATAGLEAGDRIVKINGAPIMNESGLVEELMVEPGRPATLSVVRSGRELDLTIGPRASIESLVSSVEFQTGYRLTHPSPFAQIADVVSSTVHNLRVMLSRHSDVGLSKMSGPIGIVHIFMEAAEAGIRYVLMITILVNVSFAVLNLLPIPVLDGGQILFATIGRLRGRALPFELIAATQSVFFVLLISMILYVSFYDIKRWSKDARDDRALATPTPAAAKP